MEGRYLQGTLIQMSRQILLESQQVFLGFFTTVDMKTKFLFLF